MIYRRSAGTSKMACRVRLHPVVSGWLRDLVAEEWLSQPPGPSEAYVLAGHSMCPCIAGSVLQNRRLSLRCFEPNTCHYVSPAQSGFLYLDARLVSGG
jgi:hypothetical protein